MFFFEPCLKDLTEAVIDISWRWVIWIAFLCTGLNFLAIFLFFAETQFTRDSTLNSASEITESTGTDSKEIKVENIEALDSSDQGRVYQKKSYLAQLSPWSGRRTSDNLLGTFVRSFPTILYPVIFWVFLSCELLKSWTGLTHCSKTDRHIQIPFLWLPP